MEMSVSLILAGLMLVLMLLFILKKGGQSVDSSFPPGPSGFSLLGTLLQMTSGDVPKIIIKLSETYGPVMSLTVGTQRLVFLVGLDVMKEALVDQEADFSGRTPIVYFERLDHGYGMNGSNGHRWWELRHFTDTTIAHFVTETKKMEEWIQEEIRHMLDRIDSTKAAPFDSYFFAKCFSANVHFCLMFGQRLDEDDEDFLLLMNCISEALGFSNSFHFKLYNALPGLMKYLPGPHQTVFDNVDKGNTFIRKKIDEHQETFDPSSPRDFIDCFLIRSEKEKENPTTEFHYDNMWSTVFGVMLGGLENVPRTLTYSFGMLIQYPQIQEQIQKEIDDVIGRERSPCMEDRKSLPLTNAFIHEVLRSLDLVPMTARYTMQDVTFRGYRIPKDTAVLIVLESALRDEKHWATPLTFNHQHFLDEKGNFKENAAFLALSAGIRDCPGKHLARMALLLALVSLLQRFTFSCPGGPEHLDLTLDPGALTVVHMNEIVASPRW